MISHQTQIKVRYHEVDRMGYLHHSIYAIYLEIARTNFLEKIGISYKKLEDKGIIMPVYSLSIQYKSPAFYEDVLIINATMTELPKIKIPFEYKVTNQDEKLICTAQSINAIVDAKKNRPIKITGNLHEIFSAHFTSE